MSKHATTMRPGTTGAIEHRIADIKDSVKGLVDKGGQRVEEIRTRVIDARDQAMSRGNVALDQATGYIKAHPMKAIGLAFGLGYLGMRLFRR